MIQKQDNLKKIQDFCVDDIKIKEILYSLAPDKNYLYSEDYRLQLSDKMFEGLKEIKFYMDKTVSNFELNSYKPHIDELYKRHVNELAEAGTDVIKLEKFYKNCLSDMSPEIVKETGETCVGYALRSAEALQVVNKTKTINELLHVIHSKIINNDNMYRCLPVTESIQCLSGDDCNLYGNNTKLAQEVLACSAAVKDTGATDIISLNNDQMIMMIRDKGHALSIQISRNEENSFDIKYFIPKLCNQEMINNLPGVNQINENSTYTVGSFTANEEVLGLKVMEFIANVPTDSHMNYGETDNTVPKKSYKDVLNEMDCAHLVNVIQKNEVLSNIDGIEKFVENKVKKDYASNMEELNRLQKFEGESPRLQWKIDKIMKNIERIEAVSEYLEIEINEPQIENQTSFENTN